jgi:cation transport ATPase
LATIDQRLLTGEAQPYEAGPGDLVFAATALLAGRITLIVKEAGTATVAAHARF